MRKFFAVFGILLILVIAGLAALPFLLSPDFVGQQLQAAVKKATGRTLTLTSAPKISVWPELAVELGGATLSNPPGLQPGTFAAMDKLVVRVGMRALLTRKLEIREITLVRPNLNLLINQRGRANWDFAHAQSAPSSGKGDRSGGGSSGVKGFESIDIAPVNIRKGKIRFLDERTGAIFAAERVNLTLKMANQQSPLKASGDLVWNGQPVNLSTLYIKSPMRLAVEGSPVEIAIASPLLDFSFSGRAAFAKGFNLAGRLNTSTSSIRELAAWAGNPLPAGNGLQAFSARTGFDWSGNTLSLVKATLNLDGMNAQGSLKIALGNRPQVTGALGIDRINVNAYVPRAEKKASSGEGALVKGWNTAPIDFSPLKALDANLKLSTNRIDYGEVRIGATVLTVTLKDGVLDATLDKMAFYSGNASGRIVLNGARKAPTIQGALSAADLDGYQLLKDFAKFKRIAGKTTIKLSLAAQGRSQAELVSALNGNASFRFTNGAIRGVNIPAMVRNVDKAILGGWDDVKEQDTDFSELSANFAITKGIARTEDLKLIGPLVRLTGTGTADMPRQRLDFRIEPKIVASLKGQGGTDDLKGLPVPVIVRGPWAKPKIYPDIEGILKNPQAAFDALAKLGVGKNIDTKALKEKVEKKVEKKIEKIVDKNLDKVLDKTTKDLLKDESKSVLKKQGKSILKNLIGGD